MRDLIDVCMRTNVNERPSAMDIVQKLQVTSPSANLSIAPLFMHSNSPSRLLFAHDPLNAPEYLTFAAPTPSVHAIISNRTIAAASRLCGCQGPESQGIKAWCVRQGVLCAGTAPSAQHKGEERGLHRILQVPAGPGARLLRPLLRPYLLQQLQRAALQLQVLSGKVPLFCTNTHHQLSLGFHQEYLPSSDEAISSEASKSQTVLKGSFGEALMSIALCVLQQQV